MLRMSGGFSLVEVTLSISLVSVLTALLLPVGMQFFSAQTLAESAERFRMILWAAEQRAVLGYHGSPIGVAVLPGQVVLFEGESYAARNRDRDISYDFEDVEMSGANEVVFTSPSGIPVDTASFELDTSQADPIRLSVSSIGLIEQE